MKKPCLLLEVALVVILGAICDAVHVEWPVGEGGNGHFYEAVLVTEGIGWESAQAAATDAGGYLATITSEEENMFVYSLVSGNSDYWLTRPYPVVEWSGPWLGGSLNLQSAEWEWVTGEAFTYSNLAPHPPLPWDYAYLHFWGSGDMSPQWLYHNNYFLMNGYLVEYIPEPSTLLLLGLGVVLVRRKRATKA